MIMWLRLRKTWAVFKGQNEKKLPPRRLTEAANVAESIPAEALPVLCQGTLLKLGQALHETPFSNRNHKKKKWWFSVVFTQNQVMFCGSATFWHEARERSLCVLDLVLCFMGHLVWFPKPEIWGSDEGCKQKNMKVEWSLGQIKMAPGLQGPPHSPGLLSAPVLFQHSSWKELSAHELVPWDFLLRSRIINIVQK